MNISMSVGHDFELVSWLIIWPLRDWDFFTILCSLGNFDNCETQPPASIGWAALSSVVRCSFVPHRWHLLSSPLYDVSEHTNHIFSVRIWSWQHVSADISSVAELSQFSWRVNWISKYLRGALKFEVGCLISNNSNLFNWVITFSAFKQGLWEFVKCWRNLHVWLCKCVS